MSDKTRQKMCEKRTELWFQLCAELYHKETYHGSHLWQVGVKLHDLKADLLTRKAHAQQRGEQVFWQHKVRRKK